MLKKPLAFTDAEYGRHHEQKSPSDIPPFTSDDGLSPRTRSRSLGGDRGSVAAGSGNADPTYANPGPAEGLMAPLDQDGEAGYVTAPSSEEELLHPVAAGDACS